jgi:hypothetical protein
LAHEPDSWRDADLDIPILTNARAE